MNILFFGLLLPQLQILILYIFCFLKANAINIKYKPKGEAIITSLLANGEYNLIILFENDRPIYK